MCLSFIELVQARATIGSEYQMLLGNPSNATADWPTTVRFKGQNASFTLDSPNQITATVPMVASSGPITVIAAGGGSSTSTSKFAINLVVVAQPRLSIALDGQNIVLSWPANALSYSLEQSTDLNPAKWVSYAGPVVLKGESKTATLTAPNDSLSLFFRLTAPVTP